MLSVRAKSSVLARLSLLAKLNIVGVMEKMASTSRDKRNIHPLLVCLSHLVAVFTQARKHYMLLLSPAMAI
jgi:hypothetical protein